MRAEFTIEHNGQGLVAQLPVLFGAHDPTVLGRTPLGQDPVWAGVITYASETPQVRLVGFEATIYSLQLSVEPLTGDLKSVCQTVWTAMHRTRQYDPHLVDLRIVDEATAQTVMTGVTGVWANLGRRELWTSLLIGAATGVWLGIALAVFSEESRPGLVGGAIPALVAGVVSLVVLIAIRGRLAWRD